MTECNIDDIVCQLRMLDHLAGMKNLVGTETFRQKYPQFSGLESEVTALMAEQKGTVTELMKKCGINLPLPGAQEEREEIKLGTAITEVSIKPAGVVTEKPE